MTDQWLGEFRPFVGNRELDGGDTFEVSNPVSGETVAKVATSPGDVVDEAVASAEEGYDRWQDYSLRERSRILSDVGAAIRAHADNLAAVETAEVGRPLPMSEVVVEAAAEHFEYYAGLVETVEGETVPVPGERLDYTLRSPYGVTAHLVPWNAALILGARSIAPALAAGNAVVCKPSNEAPVSTLELGRVATEAGLPAGVFNVVPGPGSPTGTTLVGHPDIGTVSFTGSTAVGAEVRRNAAESMTPVSLELGGKGPAVVFPDADVDGAADALTNAFMAAGQICYATTRVLVASDVADEFLEAYVRNTESLDVERRIGPLISGEAVSRTERYVDEAVEDGATLLTGGERPPLDGPYFEPTILTDVDPGAPIACDEIFGPVVVVHTFADAAEAVQIANDTEYGLSASIWTESLSRAHAVAEEIQAGTIAVNEYPTMFPQAPSGGFERSGLGRSRGQQALRFYTQLKNVTVSLDGAF